MTNEPREKIFVFGASGHAKVVIDILEKQGLYSVACVVDDNPALKGMTISGYEIAGGKEALLANKRLYSINRGIVAIGSNVARAAVAAWLLENGFGLITAIHPSAQLSRGVEIAEGTVIMAGVVLNADVIIGRNVIVNTGATIDHDCVVGNDTHIAPGVTLCGTVQVGAGAFICSGSTIIPNLFIGNRVTVGAGSTVIRDVADGLQVIGTPAREVVKRSC